MADCKCKVCGCTPEEVGFYDSIRTHCKRHWREKVRANRRANQEYYREYDRSRGNRQLSGYLRQYRKKNPEKYAAHSAVGNAVRDGKLHKKPCLMCGAEKVVGHHVDYSKPLDVIWLCQGCHKLIHAYEDLAAEIRSKDAA